MNNGTAGKNMGWCSDSFYREIRIKREKEETMKSLKEIADFLRKKAEEIESTYFLESIKLNQAAEILDPQPKGE